MNRFLPNRIPLLFLLATVVVVVLSVNSYLKIYDLIRKADQVNHSTLVKFQLNDIYISCSESDTDSRIFRITRDSTFLIRMREHEKKLNDQVSQLGVLVKETPSQSMNLVVLKDILKLRKSYRERLISNDSTKPVTREQWISGRKNMFQLRDHINRMLNEENILQHQFSQTFKLASFNTPLFSIFLTLSALLILLVTYFIIVRELRISNRLRQELEVNKQELMDSNQALLERNVSLDKMNKELESFTYISSHDLQEPLRKIQTFISRIHANSEGLSDENLLYLERTQESARRMQTLIQDLLMYSRVNNEEVETETVDFRKWVQSVIAEIQDQIQESHTKIQIKGDGKIQISTLQFNQLLLNLLTNAMKFVPKEKNPRIEIKLRQEKDRELGNLWVLSVKDNGIGIDLQYHQRVFEVFQRLHSRDEFSGTGVGLAIVKKIVENHKGSVGINSKKGEGTEFIVKWPTDPK